MATCQADARILSLHGHGSTTGVANIDQALRRFHIMLYIPADATGGEATARQHPYFYVDKALTVVSGTLIPHAALIANDTNYATIGFGTDDGAGGTFTSACDITTKSTGGTGNWVAGTAIALTGLTNADTFTAGTYLGVKVAKAASGVIVASGIVDLLVEYT